MAKNTKLAPKPMKGKRGSVPYKKGVGRTATFSLGPVQNPYKRYLAVSAAGKLGAFGFLKSLAGFLK